MGQKYKNTQNTVHIGIFASRRTKEDATTENENKYTCKDRKHFRNFAKQETLLGTGRHGLPAKCHVLSSMFDWSLAKFGLAR